PSSEPCGTRDVEGLLADLAHAAADNLADLQRIDARAFDRGALHCCQQIRRMRVRKTAAALAERRSHGLDDDNVVVVELRHRLTPLALHSLAMIAFGLVAGIVVAVPPFTRSRVRT